MGKCIENINSLTAYFVLYDIDEEEEPIVRTTDFNELLKALIDLRTRNGCNWDNNLLFVIEDETGDSVIQVDVKDLELFV